MWKRGVCVLVLSLMAYRPCAGAVEAPGATQAADGTAKEVAQEPRHSLTQAEQDHVTLTVETYDAEEIDLSFSFDLIRKGVEPILLQIDNRSGQTYAFHKADVDGYLPASQVAQYAYADPATKAVRETQWFALSAPVEAVGWAAKSVLRARVASFRKSMKHRPKENREVQEDFVRQEIADKAIEPNGSLIGYVFLRLSRPTAPITVKLTNVQTNEPLVFEISPAAGGLHASP